MKHRRPRLEYDGADEPMFLHNLVALQDAVPGIGEDDGPGSVEDFKAR